MKFRFITITFALIVLLLGGCAEPRQTTSETKTQDYVLSSSKEASIKSYEVEGEGDEYFEARRNAIIDGIRKASIELIGDKKFKDNFTEINKLILQDRKIVNEISEFSSTAILDRSGKKVVKGITKVKVDLLKSHLDKVIKDKPSQNIPSESITKKDQLSTNELSTKKVEQNIVEFNPKNDSVIYDISFLVFVPNDKIEEIEDSDFYKVFIEIVNSKLSEYGLNYVEFKRSMELSKKFQYIYEEKSGQTMSLAQMLAQELKADVYIEVDAEVRDNLATSTFSDTTIIGSIKAYDASTGKGLGSSTFSRNKKSQKSAFENRIDILTEVVEQEMPKVLKMIEDYFQRGIRINVVIIGFKNVSEEREFSNILDRLPGIGSKKRKSISGNASEYEITYKGGSSDFVDDLINAVATDPKYSKIKIDQSVNKIIITLK